MGANSAAGRHYVVGGGIAGLAVALYLVRDAGVPGEDIIIFEQLDRMGGSLDGSGQADSGYLIRGGRMFEKHFACTFDLFRDIPSADDPSVSVTEDIYAFNRMVPGSSNCRLIRNGKPAGDRYDLTLNVQGVYEINRLLLHPEATLGNRTIEDWFDPGFFESNFWLMWATMFSFQPWHSLVEMRRYLLRFIHLFPGFTRIAGILRTRYNQYDSLIAPLVGWLRMHGVEFRTDTKIIDVTIDGEHSDRYVRALVFEDGTNFPISQTDRVYLTLGSMTDSSALGTNTTAPVRDDREGGAWTLWRTIASNNHGFGRPEVFCTEIAKTAWNSFSVTLDGPEFVEFLEDYTNNRTGTGGLITLADSGWILSFVIFHQPHFKGQKKGTYTFWGYGLLGERNGDFVKKPMWEATGDEIIVELAGHLGLTETQKEWFKGARVLPCRMPFITSQFMPRSQGDRPDVLPEGSRNFAVIGQYCEMPRDCVFTVEYSVRSARTAVSKLTGRVAPPPPVARTYLSPAVLTRAARVLAGF